jgi:ribosomal protein L11 methylase PrmA
LAGLLADQAEAIIEAYAPEVALSVADHQEEWVLLGGLKH